MGKKSRKKQKPNKITSWFNTHKKELIIGSGLLIIIGLSFVYRAKQKQLMHIVDKIAPQMDSDVASQITEPVTNNLIGVPKSPHYRNGHIRKLKNAKASSKKIMEAIEQNIPLGSNETFVKSANVNRN